MEVLADQHHLYEDNFSGLGDLCSSHAGQTQPVEVDLPI